MLGITTNVWRNVVGLTPARGSLRKMYLKNSFSTPLPLVSHAMESQARVRAFLQQSLLIIFSLGLKRILQPCILPCRQLKHHNLRLLLPEAS